MTRVIGLGAGGHAKVVIDTLRLIGGFDIVGLLDPRLELHGREVLGVPVIGDDGLLPEIARQGIHHAFIGVGGGDTTTRRREVYERARSCGFDIVTVIHPDATIALSAVIGAGATILAGAVVNAAATLGAHVIVNSAAVIEHDCEIGDHVHVSVGAMLGGGVRVGEATLIGLGAVVRHGISIGRLSIVGAGAVVVDDVPDGVVVVGTPARVVRAVRAST
jgi:UDP-perosamine 4-acetyltransferase